MSGKGAGRFPDFLVIGAMKAGTTTLWEQLASHPDVFMCQPKEPQFFSRDPVYARGFDWYRSLFAGAAPEQRCGEASACYTRWPEFPGVPARIARSLPDVKLVYVVRHPVERAYSHYGHEMEERRLYGTGPQLTFEEALERVPDIVASSQYAAQLGQYLAHFRREAIHVLAAEDLQQRFAPTWQALERFLGVRDVAPEAGAARARNQAGDRLARVEVRRTLERLRATPLLGPALARVPRGLRGRLREWLRSDGVARLLMRRSVAQHRTSLSPLRAETRAGLAARFAADVEALEGLLGRELPSYRA